MLKFILLSLAFALPTSHANEGGGNISTPASLDITSKTDFFYLSLSQKVKSTKTAVCSINRQIGLLGGATNVGSQNRPRFPWLYTLGDLIEENTLMIHRNELFRSLSSRGSMDIRRLCMRIKRWRH